MLITDHGSGEDSRGPLAAAVREVFGEPPVEVDARHVVSAGTAADSGSLAGVFIRYPAPGSWLCNLNHGGRAEPSQLDADEADLALTVGWQLAAEGIVIAGLDTLRARDGRRLLSEVNTLNPGGFYAADLGHTDGQRTVETTAAAIARHLRAQE